VVGAGFPGLARGGVTWSSPEWRGKKTGLFGAARQGLEIPWIIPVIADTCRVAGEENRQVAFQF
jgi:hypothetical protein